MHPSELAQEAFSALPVGELHPVLGRVGGRQDYCVLVEDWMLGYARNHIRARGGRLVLGLAPGPRISDLPKGKTLFAWSDSAGLRHRRCVVEVSQ